MKLYQIIYAGVILTVLGVGIISPEIRTYCGVFLIGSGVGWLIHLIGTTVGTQPNHVPKTTT